jgi:tetratricopeptide (TPR) repeat protein
MAIQRDKVIASAEKLVAKGKIEPAIKEYERLLEDNPNDVNTLNRIGDLWVRINRNDEAVKVFGKIAAHYSKDGFFLKAIAIYKKINKLDPSQLDIYAKLADLYAKQGLAMEAKSQYQVLADYYLKHGDPGNALAIYRKISELDPNSINVHVKLADLYSQNNQTAEALKEYDRVGRMLLKRGMLDEAVQVFRKALKIDASNVELVESLITALLEAKDFENAMQIVDTSLESNRDNPRLLALLGRVQLARGDMGAARTALERGVSADPSNVSVREALADLYLRQSNPDKALEMVVPLVEKALARGERGASVDLLNRILRVDSGHTPTLERLVLLYTRLNEETNILASMSSLAEAHVARSQYEDASKVLERLIQREPQNAQHRTKLQFVRSQMGGIDTIPARGRTVDTPMPPMPPMSIPSMEIEEPVPSFESFGDDSISLDLDASEPLDLDLGGGFTEAPPPSTQAPPPRFDMDEMASLDSDLEGGEDLDFITEHLTEAEVFAKYGLAEKAAEHLRAVIERAPKHIAAHEKLYRILLDEGDIDGARAAANQYVAILEERGESDTVTAVKNEFVTRGHTLAPAAAKPARTPTVERPIPPPAPAPEPLLASELADEGEISFDLESPSGETEFDLDSMSLESEPEPAPAPAFEPAATGPAFDIADLELEEPEPALGDLAFDDVEDTEPQAAADPFFGVEAESVAFDDGPSVEEIGEVDFYIEQELFDEARGKLDLMLARHQGNTDLKKRKDRLEAAAAASAAIASMMTPAVAPAKPAPPPVAPPPPAPAASSSFALSKDDIESELLSALPDDDDDFGSIAPPPPPPPPAAAFVPPVAPDVVEENLFADEDDFFDLAAELESEMSDEDEQISLSEEEQSLEEIFKEFKKGVEQQLDSEDYDTHYNLGIAYKEMGLIDEAIGEFQLASKDPKRSVECASMLGLCFLEKGMPQLAIKWYRKGLEIAEITEEEHVGLLYDLGSAYVEVGDTDNAQKAFMEVYGMNTNYREIVTRIKQLEDARK